MGMMLWCQCFLGNVRRDGCAVGPHRARVPNMLHCDMYRRVSSIGQDRRQASSDDVRQGDKRQLTWRVAWPQYHMLPAMPPLRSTLNAPPTDPPCHDTIVSKSVPAWEHKPLA